MEDIIPVLIVIILLVSVGNLRAELDIMLDFIASDPEEMEAEKRLLINLSVPPQQYRNPITTSSETGNSHTNADCR